MRSVAPVCCRPDRPPRKRLFAPVLGMSPTSKALQEVNAAVAIAGRKRPVQVEMMARDEFGEPRGGTATTRS